MNNTPETKDEALEVIAGTMPLEALLTSPGFERNSALLLDPETLNPTISPKLTRAIAQLAVSGAVKRAESKQRASATNTDNAKAKRKDVTCHELEAFREEHVIRNGHERGWKKAACLQFGVTGNTINARLKKKE